jgi:uncharacterized protein
LRGGGSFGPGFDQVGIGRKLGARAEPRKELSAGFDQYHEPPEELPAEARTFARLCASLIEEAEAIDWYHQRLAIEPDAEARAIMTDALGEEFKHFAMDLEFLLRRTPLWREIAQGIPFTEGDIVELSEESEAVATEQEAEKGVPLSAANRSGLAA